MFRNNRAARIIFPLIIIAVLVVVMELVDHNKTVDDTTDKNGKKIEKIIGKCSVEIECKNILKNKDLLDLDLRDSVPKDGIILKKTKVDLKKGDSAYTVLYRITKDKNISMESRDTAGSKYIRGIDNFYEFGCGDESGWLYLVNGKKLGISSSEAKLKNGDEVRWSYTCNLGKDVKENK